MFIVLGEPLNEGILFVFVFVYLSGIHNSLCLQRIWFSAYRDEISTYRTIKLMHRSKKRNLRVIEDFLLREEKRKYIT